MKRRRFLPTLAAPLLARPSWAAETLEPKFHRLPPFHAYIQKIPNASDEFGDLQLPPPKPQSPRPANTRFAEITGSILDNEQLSRGIPYWLARLDPATGIDIYGNNGIAAGDIDNDGRDEIYVCQPSGLPNKLFKFTNGKLEDISVQSGVDLLDDSASALFLDLRNSGLQDLIVLRSAGPVLFLNQGNGKFKIVPNAFQFATPPRGAFTGMASADYDRDGKLDLYCCTYTFFQSEAQFSYPTPYFDAQNGPPNFLFKNRLNRDGSGHFEDVTAPSGLNHNNNRFSFAPAWCDFDNSGFPSLYVANDFGRNNLYKNTNGTFTDIAKESGVEDIGPGMSAAWFDANADGLPDLYVANMWTSSGQAVTQLEEFKKRFPENLQDPWRRHAKGNTLYINSQESKFTEAAGSPLEMGRWAWSADAADFDNDGHPEIFITAGMLTGSKQPDLMSFFWRQVVAKSPTTPTRNAEYEEGWNAINQFIREGYSWNGHESNIFYVPDGETWKDASAESGLDFAGDSRAFAITDLDNDGCLDVVVKSRLGPQLRVFQNRAGQSKPRIAFRLNGTESNRDAIGARIRYGGQTKWLSAGSGYLSQHTKTLYFAFKDEAAAEILWPSGLTLTFRNLQPNRLYKINESAQEPASEPFANPNLIPAKTAPADNTPRLHDAWLADPVPLPEPFPGPNLLILHAAQKPEFGGALFADLRDNPDRLAAFTLFRRYLFEFRAPLELPFVLLLNHSGHAVKVYATLPTKEQLAADLKSLFVRKALPYEGIAFTQPRRDYFKLGAAFLWSGYPEQALPYLEEVIRQDPANVRSLVYAAQIHRGAGRIPQASQLLEQALKHNPQSPEAWNEIGGVALAQNNPAAALEHFQQALKLSPNLVYVILNAGQTAANYNQPSLASEYFRRALSLDPTSAAANNGLGLLLAKEGKNEEAEKLLKQATTLEPSLATAWNNLAVLYLRMNKVPDSLKAFEQGIQNAPQEESLYLNLGRAHLQAGDAAQALAVMRRLLAAKPDSEVAKKAISDLEKAAPR